MKPIALLLIAALSVTCISCEKDYEPQPQPQPDPQPRQNGIPTYTYRINYLEFESAKPISDTGNNYISRIKLGEYKREQVPPPNYGYQIVPEYKTNYYQRGHYYKNPDSSKNTCSLVFMGPMIEKHYVSYNRDGVLSFTAKLYYTSSPFIVSEPNAFTTFSVSKENFEFEVKFKYGSPADILPEEKILKELNRLLDYTFFDFLKYEKIY